MKAKLAKVDSNGQAPRFDPEAVLLDIGTTARQCPHKHIIFSQGDYAGCLFYIGSGRIRLTVVSYAGKGATVAILGKGDFLGEECLAPAYSLRLASAVAMTDCSLVQIERQCMLAALARDPALAKFFWEYVLECKIRTQEDLADRLSHGSEKRLIRLLLMLANHNGRNGHDLPEISQEILAEMVGTTRPRISYFMNKFKKLGLVDYNDGLQVRKELEDMLL